MGKTTLTPTPCTSVLFTPRTHVFFTLRDLWGWS